MLIVHVFIHVKNERIQEFKAATRVNTQSSLEEPGIARFDFIEQLDEPGRFVLVEVYRTPEDAAKHKETAHYATWRDSVADMMADPRSSIKYANVFPDEKGWDLSG